MKKTPKKAVRRTAPRRKSRAPRSGSPGGLGPRLHHDAPPHGLTENQTQGFVALLHRLYAIEDSHAACSRGGADAVAFAEARAICERFVPAALAETLRNKYD